MSDTSTADASTAKPVLKLVFLTLFLDLIGFSILFPLFPELLDHYLGAQGPDSAIGGLMERLESLVEGRADPEFAVVVLFGGLLGSLYSILQFLFAPFWGGLSDRIGRKRTLAFTIAGTALSYVLWFFAGTFELLIAARVLGGIMAGNIATASAVVADVSPPAKRTKNMAVVGIAIGLGFVLGPAIGALSYAYLPVAEWWPGGAELGVNPFSGAALVALLLSLLNLLQVLGRFPETRKAGAPNAAESHRRLPFRGMGVLADKRITRANFVHLLYGVAFAAMEFTLVFLAAERLEFGPTDNAKMFVFIGLTIAFVQGGFVRRRAESIGEQRLLLLGLFLLLPGFVTVGLVSTSVAQLYLGLFLLAAGSAMVMPTLSSLVSLYAPEESQGLAQGSFRSMGSLARAVGPLLGGLLYWGVASWAPYHLGALFLLLPLGLAAGLPQPDRGEAPAA